MTASRTATWDEPAALPVLSDNDLANLLPCEHEPRLCVACGREFARPVDRWARASGRFCSVTCLLGHRPAIGDEDVWSVRR